MALGSLIYGKGPSGFGYGSTAVEVTEGILVTGCNAGLGLETVRVLAMRGARVLATGRTEEKARSAVADLAGDIVPLACELSNPASVRACIEAVKKDGHPIDVLLCNAGMTLRRLLACRYSDDLGCGAADLGPGRSGAVVLPDRLAVR